MRAESNAIVVAIQLGVGAALSIVADPFDELRERQCFVWRTFGLCIAAIQLQ